MACVACGIVACAICINCSVMPRSNSNTFAAAFSDDDSFGSCNPRPRRRHRVADINVDGEDTVIGLSSLRTGDVLGNSSLSLNPLSTFSPIQNYGYTVPDGEGKTDAVEDSSVLS